MTLNLGGGGGGGMIIQAILKSKTLRDLINIRDGVKDCELFDTDELQHNYLTLSTCQKFYM